MPNRILREGILTSERIARLAWPEEVFYRRLMSAVDDFGRYYANPALLRAALYPLQIDKVSDSDIGKWLTACVNAALVRVYPASDGKRYLELLDFRQQVRAKESRFPALDLQLGSISHPDATQLRSTRAAYAHLDGDGDVFGDVDVKPSASSAEPTGGVPPSRALGKHGKPAVPACPYREIVGAYHDALPMLPRLKSFDGKLWDGRCKAMRELWSWVLRSTREDGTRRAEDAAAAMEWVQTYFATAAHNDWITGRKPPGNGHENWRCDIDYLLTPSGMKQVMEKTEVTA